jgi:hypothetical protein
METVQDRQISSLMGTIAQAPDQRDCFSTTSWMQLHALWDITFDNDDIGDNLAVRDGTLHGFCGRPTYPLPVGNTYSSIAVPSRNGGCTYSLLAPPRQVKSILNLHKMIDKIISWQTAPMRYMSEDNDGDDDIDRGEHLDSQKKTKSTNQ